ncbi:MAG: bifunctional proline dehydrogenase/L-glutamate gamma-semialdehyde dehydrogenase PutA [Rickettsiaceae bacterium]|nr:bifunctional proline dehydrogenase/L-glutamate gamma-semialdehyde dehydrogenase PutA [Rickettsiaceae bacterium]
MTIKIFAKKLPNEIDVIKRLLLLSKLPISQKKLIISNSKKLITKIREDHSFSMESFLHLYSLTYDEGVALLGLAEGLLRIPDDIISKELVLDKLSGKSWESFLFKKTRSIKTVLASFGLYFAGKFADITKCNNTIANLCDRLGQPVFIKTLKAAILFLSKEFVFADDMHAALEKTQKHTDYKFAFDLLGESSRTMKQANIYLDQYKEAINLISNAFPYKGEALEDRPNLSVKLTALYPRVELLKFEDLEKILLPKLIDLVERIKNNHLTITFDAEESYRNDAYLMLITKLIKHKSFEDFSGIGVVIQAYQTRSSQIIEYIIAIAKESKKKIPVRLVKGAYWDSEIKHAQELGLENYPVFTRKEYTDLSFIACSKKIIENTKYIYPQFATHNASTAATIMELAGDKKYEFQKLYGMGNTLHKDLINHRDVRVYAPVGNTKDLLAYLIRRMLENGASANFVSKVYSKELTLDELAYDINDRVLNLLDNKCKINLPEDIYPNRKGAMGYELGYKNNYDYIQEKVSSYYDQVHIVGSIIDGSEVISAKHADENFCPGKNAEKFSSISNAVEKEIKNAIDSAANNFEQWNSLDIKKRAQILLKVAKAFEDNKFELYALLIKEAGKSIHDAINEVIEAIDFCRYYANQAQLIMQEKKLPGPTGETNVMTMHGRGVFLCISPWNFPFAIFVGQIAAALISGNTVIAKPAGQTAVIANFTVKLMHKMGVSKSALHLLIASGSNINKYAIEDERVAGVVFTGSCGVAKAINTTLAARNSGIVPFIAETGGQNAMIVDSSALLEQVTDDVLTSSFYSAGQRCSALRMLYVQEEIYDELLEMIKGATELLEIGDTSNFSKDIGPIIDQNAKNTLSMHIEDMKDKGFTVFAHPHNDKQKDGHYFYPHIIEVNTINDIPDEKFGPILHITKYKAKNLDKVIDEINNCGFGLTFGIHSRIEEKISYIRSKIKVGNIYANRSTIGAKVESQPFGGENKSGTGFKAGGPNYLLRFMTERTTTINTTAFGGDVE